jgi:hypothetical protein
MARDDTKELLEKGLRFFGRETARQTHEITNVLNIINELGGLLGDMAYAAKQGQAFEPDRIEEIAEKVQRQVKRGEIIVRGLNRFSHSADVLKGIFGLEELNDRLVFLSERPVRLARAKLRIEEPPRNASLDGFLLGYQDAVLNALDLILQTTGCGIQVQITYSVDDDRVGIHLEGDQPRVRNDDSESLHQRLTGLMREIGGSLTSSPDGETPQRLDLVFPQAKAAED